jgi:AcrR family transcriptional regulator
MNKATKYSSQWESSSYAEVSTLERLTEKAKLSQGVMNSHFKSKEARYDAILGGCGAKTIIMSGPKIILGPNRHWRNIWPQFYRLILI